MSDKNGGGRAGKDKETKPTLIAVAFPQTANVVFFSALAVGALLIGLPPVFRSQLLLSGTQLNLLICAGLAIVLAAFGGQATVRIGGIVMAGVAAITLGLFYFLEKRSEQIVMLRGTIGKFDNNRYSALGIKQDDKSFFGVLRLNENDPSNSHYEFVLFQNEMSKDTRDVISIYLGDLEIPVRITEVLPYFGSDRRIRWELIETRNADKELVWTLVNPRDNSTVGVESARARARSGAPAPPPPRTFNVIGSAFAQGAANVNVPAMLGLLKSENAATRRAARDALSRAPVTAVPDMLRAFGQDFNDYQIRLGVSVALAQMLRANKPLGRQISGMLSDDDIERLVRAAGDSDRTVRIYASEFLFDLGDPRAAKSAIQLAAKVNDENARYNLLFSAQDGWRELGNTEKQSLRPALDRMKAQSGSQTQALIDKFK